MQSDWVLKKQVDQLYANALSANISVFGSSLVIALLLFGRVESPLVILWVAVTWISVAVRLFILWQYRKAPDGVKVITWATRYILASLLAGIAWADLALLLYLHDDFILQILVFTIIIAVIAASVPVLSPLLPALHTYLLPPAIVLTLTMFSKGGQIDFLLGLGLIIFTALMLTTAKNINQKLHKTLLLEKQNKDLILELSAEIDQRRTAQFQIEQHKDKLEDLVGERTKQLLEINESLERQITERKRAEENLKHLALYDPLTNLPNRLLLMTHLDHAIQQADRTGKEVIVLFMDLDHFKNINDSLGHAAGDDLLRTVSARLREGLRKDDTIARLGGDEFVIVMEQAAMTDDGSERAEKIMQILSGKFDIQGHELFIGASIGISRYPRDGTQGDELIQHADAAMYAAKEVGRNNYQFYTPDLTTLAYDRVMLEGSLRRALELNELEVYYQPQVSLSDGALVGFEALLRWQHKQQGLLAPSVFLKVAEDSGLIVQIGEQVLHTACRQMTNWRMAGVPVQHMAVNLSGRQIRDQRLIDSIQTALQKTGCEPQWLELEVTEGFIMQETEQSIQTLDALAEVGINLAIDDFGTGYSSLSYLKRLPIQKLKIDKSFVRDLTSDPNDAAIVKAIIAMGQSLQLEIIAEGVETKEQESFLQAQHCEQAQGFYYGKPMSAQDVQSWLEDRSA